MPDSLFGSPTSHLLTQVTSGSPPTASGNAVGVSTPVCHPPPSFADVHFDTIGKPPNLLSRISDPEPAVRSLSPLTSPPLPAAVRHVLNSQKLVERIQKSPIQSSSSKQSLATSGTNRHRYVTPNAPVSSGNLIPPIEILSTANEPNLVVSSSDTQPSFQQVQTLENRPNIAREISLPDLAYPTTAPNSIKQANLDFPPSNPSVSPTLDSPVVLPPGPVQSSVSFMTTAPSPNLPEFATGVSVTAAEAPQNSAAQDNISVIHTQPQAKCDTLASLIPPTLCSRSPSPFEVPRNISELAANLHNEMNTTEHNAIVLHHPYPQNKSTSNVSSDINALTPASSQTPSQPASHRAHLLSLVEAMKKLQTAAGSAIRVQLEADQALASERMEFDERRRVFEERIFAREAECQAQIQSMQKQLEELRSREQRLVAMEEESRLRDEARRARDTQRRAQDDQRSLEDKLRRKAIDGEIADAIQLIEQAKVEKRRWEEEIMRSERSRAVAQVNTLPLQVLADIGPRIEKEDGMTEEEIDMVDKYNQGLARVSYLSEKLQSLVAYIHQLSDALQRLKVPRLQAAEEEHRRIADQVESRTIQAGGTKQGVQAETVRQKIQAQAERRIFQLEETVRRDEEQGSNHKQEPEQPLSVGKERLSQVDPTQRPAHPEWQKSHRPPNAEVESARLHTQLVANKQQSTSEYTTLVYAERAGLVALPVTRSDCTDGTDPDVEIDELESSPVMYAAPLPGQQTVSRRKIALKKMKTAHSRGTSGKVMLGTSLATSSRLPDARIPLTPPNVTRSDASTWSKTPSFVSASTEVGRQVITDAPLYPTEFASESDLPASPLPNVLVSTSRNTSPSMASTSQAIPASQINEITVGPPTYPLPAHQDANLRHIKQNRYRLQSNSEDVKRHDDDPPIKMVKTEEGVDVTSNATPGGTSTPPMDVTVQHDDPPSTRAILNTSNSQSCDPQTSAKLINQAPDMSSCNDTRRGDLPRPMPSTTPLSPDPLVVETAVKYQDRNAISVLPCSDPPDSAYHHGSEHDSQKVRQTTVRTRSPEPFTRRQRRSYNIYNVDHYSPPPTLPSRSRPLERGSFFARPRLKRPADCDIEDDSRDRRRRRSDHYEPEQDRGFRHTRGLTERRSPIDGWRGSRSISPDGKPYSPQPRSLQYRIEYSPTVDERRSIENDYSYGLDNTNVADVSRGPSDAGYSTEDYATPDEPQGGIALLQRMSSGPAQAGRAHPARGRGRGRGDSGRGKGGRGRAQLSLSSSRPLEDRIARD